MIRAPRALQQQIKSIEVSALLDTEGECITVWGGSNVKYVPYPIRTVCPRSRQTTEVSYSPVRVVRAPVVVDSSDGHRHHVICAVS
jgi:hypothetical protein